MANWTEQEKFSSQIAITYDADIEYNDQAYTYNGKKLTIWTEETKQ